MYSRASYLVSSANTSTKCEIFKDDMWIEFDGHGTTDEKSREFYKNFVFLAEGSFPLRYDGVVASEASNENSVFYKYKSRG